MGESNTSIFFSLNITVDIYFNVSEPLHSNSIYLVMAIPFFSFFSLSPLRPKKFSRSSSIFYSIFSRYFNFYKILVSSFRVVVAAV